MTPRSLLPLTPAPTLIALLCAGGLTLAATACWWGPTEPSNWIAAGLAAAVMTLVCAASLEVMLRMTKAGHGIAGVFAGMLVRLSLAMALVLGLPAVIPGDKIFGIEVAALVHMLMLNYLAGLVVETTAAARTAGQMQGDLPGKSAANPPAATTL